MKPASQTIRLYPLRVAGLGDLDRDRGGDRLWQCDDGIEGPQPKTTQRLSQVQRGAFALDHISGLWHCLYIPSYQPLPTDYQPAVEDGDLLRFVFTKPMGALASMYAPMESIEGTARAIDLTTGLVKPGPYRHPTRGQTSGSVRGYQSGLDQDPVHGARYSHGPFA